VIEREIEVEYKELIPILEDLQKEVLLQSPDVSTIILIADHISGESRYYSTGFAEVQATMLKMLLDKDKMLAMTLYLSALEVGKGS
jgi:hypothetical protein